MLPNCLAGLDTVVQIAAVRPILSATVAFVALSGEAEYAYAWLFASVVTRGVAPPENRRLRGQRGRHGWGSNPFLQGAAGNAAS